MSRCKANLIISIYMILSAALTLTGGIFLIASSLNLQPLTALVVALASALGLLIYPIMLMTREYSRPRESIRRKIEKLGQGRLDQPLVLDDQEIFVGLAESVNVASEKLSDKLQSIIRNTNRLSQVEDELSSLFRPRNAADEYTRDLVCRLKICTSRLKNDLNDFCLCQEQESEKIVR
ncbi:MAG: hypothetical protein CVT49_04775 [candidate division Zixibacteria bacterium HGW-Zixibacteria-1]|nr:MAG: hypothetical protein CVT49_04775 [candidate division Zixibacteria bacterium HGW-Zixibacteria-1]